MLLWLFLDMDAYFAACEQQDRPELRGRPVGVLPVMSDGSCCIAASYEAKAMGVKTGTRVWDARKLCPQIALVEARPAFYVKLHHAICRAVDQCAPIHKVYSVDELAVRLAPNERNRQAAEHLGRRIKHTIHQQVGPYLSCSVGIAPTRLLAKIACDLNKPDGLLTLSIEDLPGPLLDLKPTDLPGIGSGMQERLARHQIHTVADLWDLPRHQAKAVWGSIEGTRFWDALHGVDTPEVITRKHSFTHANVLAPELRTHEGGHAVMTRLLHKAGARLRADQMMAHRMGASMKLISGNQWQGQIDLPACQDTQTLLEHFARMWHKRPNWARSGQDPPQKVAIFVSELTPAASTTGFLFGTNERRQKLAHIMDQLNQKAQGKHAIHFGGMLPIANRHMPDKIAFGRVPNLLPTKSTNNAN